MKDINFMGSRGKFGALSVLLVIASLAYLIIFGMKLSVEFEGGIKLTITFPQEVAIGDLRQRIDALEPGSQIVQLKREAGTGSEFSIKIRKSDSDEDSHESGLGITRLLLLEREFAGLGNDDADLITLLTSITDADMVARLSADNLLKVNDTDVVRNKQHTDLVTRIKANLAESTSLVDLATKVQPEGPDDLVLGLRKAYPAINRTTKELFAKILERDNPLGREDAAYADVAEGVMAARAANNDFLPDHATLLAGAGLEATEAATFGTYMKNNFTIGHYKINDNASFSASIAAELLNNAWTAVLLALLGILIYIGLRFQWGYAAASVLALFHDVIISLGVFAALGGELSNPVVAAFLTIVGYSLNDTIVVFDRIRENINHNRKPVVVDLMNNSINQTLSRTVVTSLTTFFVVGVIFFTSGNETLEDFSLPLLIGIIVGTYSSIFVASPALLWWSNKFKSITVN